VRIFIWLGIILVNFHICGIVLVSRDRLKILVMFSVASGPECLKCRMFILSTPLELLLV